MRQRFPEFDRNRLDIPPLSERDHDFDVSSILPLKPADDVRPALSSAAERIVNAASRDACSVLMMGAHVIRCGVQRYLIDLIEKQRLSCIAMNGAGVIHDYELALIGATTESVGRYIKDGRFGLWRETGHINDIVKEGNEKGLGIGEAVGGTIESGDFPYRQYSLLAAAHRAGVPVTVHVGIGYDIVCEHPNYDGAAYGAASYRDFLRFTSIIERLEGGVMMNFGSAIMAPEVYLKALAMARNAAARDNRSVSRFTTLVADLKDLPDDFRSEPPKTSPGYYFRPWKTMLVRTVADGGESFYVRGSHIDTIPELWTAINSLNG